MIRRTTHLTDERDGWRLELRQVLDEARLDTSRRPVAIVPGYGMNSFIFGYHPRGLSLEEHLAEAGFEVWSLDLRGQGGSVCVGPRRDYDLADLAVTDLRAALELVQSASRARPDRVDVIGCSLGGTLVFVHLALVPHHTIGSVVALGAPLRWVRIHPLLRLAFTSPRLLRHVRMRHTRRLAAAVLPWLRHAPWLLRVYLHPEIVDLSDPKTLARTVEDASPLLNAEIGRWVHRGDPVVRGTDVTEAVRAMENPLLVLTANADGIVPPETARFPLDWVASTDRTYLEVGDASQPFAHADLYISHRARELVFTPIGEWLLARAPSPTDDPGPA